MASKVTNPAFWPITLFAFVWNLVGVAALFEMINITSSAGHGRFNSDYSDIFINQPLWATLAFGLAVIAGLAGCVLLALRRALSQYAFALSLGGLIIYYLWLLLAGAFEYSSVAALIISMAVLLVAILLVWFANSEKANGTLR